jgi:hypothetical protein
MVQSHSVHNLTDAVTLMFLFFFLHFFRKFKLKYYIFKWLFSKHSPKQYQGIENNFLHVNGNRMHVVKIRPELVLRSHIPDLSLGDETYNLTATHYILKKGIIAH